MHAAVFVAILLLVKLSSALVNVANTKPYTIDSQGFYDVVFQSHNSSGYYHDHASAAFLHGQYYLTDESSLSSITSVFWTHAATAFNVTLVVDLQSEYTAKEVLIQGRCCNMGIYTPTDAHLYGSNDLASNTWTWLGGSSNLESGDQTDTPAIRYRLHFVNSHLQAFRYMRVVVTGAANRYMSIRSVSIYA